MARYFTHHEAERLLPSVESAIREALDLKSQCRNAEAAIQSFTRRVMMAGGSNVNRNQVLALRDRRESTLSLLQAAVDSIHQIGCNVKDLDVGLIDFPTLFEGEEVLLCWKLGESGIRFWHGVDEGFGGRKPIDQHFLDHHRGGE